MITHILENDTTDLIVKNELKRDVYNFEKMNKKLVHSYIDLGANHGLVYLDLIKRGFILDTSILVEPLEYNFNILKNNIKNDSQTFRNVHLENKCFGPSNIAQYMSYSRSNNSGATQFSETINENNMVQSITLSDLVEKYSLDPEYLLLKCDVEGAEKYFLMKENFTIAIKCLYITGEMHGGSNIFIKSLYSHMKNTHNLCIKGTTFFIEKI